MSSDYDDFVDELPVLGDEEWGALLSGAAGNATTATATTTRGEPSSTGPGTHNLNANTSGAPAEPPPQTVQDEAASDTESTDYGDDDIFDSTFLQAVDALERGLTQAESALRTTTRQENGPSEASTSANVITASPPASRKRKACEAPSGSSENAQKRTRVDERGRFAPSASTAKPDPVNEVLAKFEDELSCPIVAGHVTNPCGHSFCGECGNQWLKINKKTVCPNCRTAVHRKAPMIPNIALDHAISVYVSSLANNGNAEWASGGAKFAEFVSRQE
ncbi:hypothetical protein K523DRAFT_345537 [Schizophyllum commune Tattone D]|nr:hypothetical protein K523DRAFT_345537 [Schizophyllum commune Tattone D]